MDDAFAVMLTLITRGNDLSDGDLEWIDRQMILPTIPPESHTRREEPLPGKAPLVFPREQLHRIGAVIGAALVRHLNLKILALAVQPWYVHLVYAPPSIPAENVRRIAETALQKLFSSEDPIWSGDYAKRFCFEEEEVASWVDYVERHNTAAGWESKLWPFVARSPQAEDRETTL